ncbi:MAG: ferredoxin [Lacunisphaera sp.]|nr:ferredoxin [Lacunisphaera sp.]
MGKDKSACVITTIAAGQPKSGLFLTGRWIIFELPQMANKAEKWKDNAAGKFYVDQQCIDCDLCRETAPGFFKRHEEGGYSFVHAQPTTEEETQQCTEALEGCPVEAIGNDGEE